MCLTVVEEKANKYKAIIMENDFLSPFNEKLSRIIGKIKSRTLNVAIVGEFSSGKTSAINALFKLDLPVDITPETATIWKIFLKGTSDVKEPLFIVKLKNGEEKQVHSVSEVKAFSPKDIKEVVVIPTKKESFIDEDIVIVDTPGLSSLEEDHYRALVEFIVEADVILVFADISQGSLTKSTIEFLYTNAINKEKTFLVYTKADKKPPSAREEVRKYAFENFSDIIEDVIVISSKKEELDELKELLKKISQEKEQILCNRLEKEIKEFCKSVIPIIENQIKSKDLSLEDLEKQEEELKQKMEELEKEVKEIEDYINTEISRIISKARTNLENKLLSKIDTIMEALYDEDLKEGIEDRFKKVFNDATQEVIKDLEDDLNQLSKNLKIRIDELSAKFEGGVLVQISNIIVYLSEYITYILSFIATILTRIPKIGIWIAQILGKEITGKVLRFLIKSITKAKIRQKIEENIKRAVVDFEIQLKVNLEKELKETLKEQTQDLLSVKQAYIKSIEEIRNQKAKRQEEFVNFLRNLENLKFEFEKCAYQ